MWTKSVLRRASAFAGIAVFVAGFAQTATRAQDVKELSVQPHGRRSCCRTAGHAWRPPRHRALFASWMGFARVTFECAEIGFRSINSSGRSSRRDRSGASFPRGCHLPRREGSGNC
jgi:hypothetical protein